MLKFNVLIYNTNENKIEPYNIIHQSLLDDIKKARKKGTINSMETLKEYLTGDFKYHYWSKTEFEIAMGWLNVKDTNYLEKIDIWTQIEMNLDLITELIKNELKFKF